MKLIWVAFYTVLFLGGLPLLSSCKIETGKANDKKKLIIASDYLEPKDTILFNSYSEKFNVRINIQHTTASKLIGIYRNKSYNTGIDLFMMKSLNDVHEIYRREISQPLISIQAFTDTEKEFVSKKYDFIEFGYDPFVIVYPINHRAPIKMYNDLTRYKFKTDLNTTEIIPMLAPIASKMKRVAANRWIDRMFKHMDKDSIFGDSVIRELPLLTNYSSFYQMPEKFKNTHRFLYPNNRSTGTFYNSRSFIISYQAENFTEAESFVLHYLQVENNKDLNNALFTLSLFDERSNFRRYYSKPDILLQHYLNISRLIEKVQ